MIRTIVSLTLSAIITLGLIVASTSPAQAETATAPTAAEAWYRSTIAPEADPICGLGMDLTCPADEPPYPWPADTLHVGVSAGRESARTYFDLDLSMLGDGVRVTRATVILPLAGSDAGTSSPELATLMACTAQGPIEEAQGGAADDAPATDCSRSTPLTYHAEDGTFTFNLAALDFTTSSAATIAIVPTDPQPPDAWRVVFDGRNRDTPDARPISASITYEPVAEPEPPTPPTSDKSGADAGSAIAPTDSTTGPEHASLPPVNPQRPDATEAPQVAPPSSANATTSPPLAGSPTGSRRNGYEFPQVWLLPLIVILGGAMLTSGLTSDYRWEPR